jgi:acetyl-CoA carboxylase biotin carboxyl carrier protein
MKLDAALVETLSRWLDATDIDRLELAGPDGSLTVCRAGATPIRRPAPPQGAIDIASPALGVFLDRHPLAAHRFAEIGDEVAAGDLLACLQVGALLTPVRAPRAGIIAACVAKPGELVGYGATLFRLHPFHPGNRP